jgi:hypothetical protein
MPTPTYYAVKTGKDRFDLRQSRYRHLRSQGGHPHDLCAVGFTAKDLRELCEKYQFDADLSALPDPSGD